MIPYGKPTAIVIRNPKKTLQQYLAKLSRNTTSFVAGWMPFGSYSTCRCTLPFGCEKVR